MQKLVIDATPKSLNVICEKGSIIFEGCSVVNDPKSFFQPIQNWIRTNAKEFPEETVVSLKIDYIDSASVKYIYEILQTLEKIDSRRRAVKLHWFFDNNDPEVLQVGEILAGRINLSFEFINSEINQYS